jgi:hypothetical protein
MLSPLAAPGLPFERDAHCKNCGVKTVVRRNGNSRALLLGHIVLPPAGRGQLVWQACSFQCLLRSRRSLVVRRRALARLCRRAQTRASAHAPMIALLSFAGGRSLSEQLEPCE